MAAFVASKAEEYEPSKAFDLGLTPEEPENIVTPGVPATVNEVPRSQFRTMRLGKEIDSGVITAYSLVLNNEPIPRFQKDVYILPPRALSKVIGHFKEDFIDHKTNKVHSIEPFESDEHLSMVNDYKLFTHNYIFAPVLYSNHWWMYVLDKDKKNFFVIDSRPKENPGPERTKINKFASNLINQLLVRAGFNSLLKKATKNRPEQKSWSAKYVKIHEQPNSFDCGTFVMKWMEMLDPTKLDGNEKYDIEDWTTEKLQEFRNQIISEIILSKSNKLIKEAIQGAMRITIHKPSAALQSPYTQVTTEELKKFN
ncbi:hypothetical protein PIB30_046487 [Stylosanthes scabra]|uniref:Ubiquitin-like protease family profile domain-containing protein n=1 Tax=Stylosanthes scabra TaxID=79078 RepID=A0ABU6VHW9_9FABA|nr:hypothetical protein [Stylosanthes scabra]